MANHLLPSTTKKAIETIVGYRFKNPNYLWEALQAHGSHVTKIDGRFIGEGNKRLALVGDSVLRLVLLGDWYPSSFYTAGATPVLVKLLSNEYLDKRGRELGLETFIVKNLAQGKVVYKRTMASTMEGILGAIYLDSGKNLEKVESSMSTMGIKYKWTDDLTMNREKVSPDPK
ncbi:uncharacterized protein K452DRAFT_278680 [Aplosporella prunicola CBS 121167]|uniref:RNase III domain-containing protein n=1 Tax=Aplosporella prunicola CBS 121167 TaxID=1176127 RepID=A0A6A6B234_9PEZI|nr:uncharacterized protein K452DRAFT_278680 [Aplosporella prunicola CBS 121167]KAF2137433.1 hypothetical protein K452DRAFT_278680 [Aplosporella prunicola CBS 121167]